MNRAINRIAAWLRSFKRRARIDFEDSQRGWL